MTTQRVTLKAGADRRIELLQAEPPPIVGCEIYLNGTAYTVERVEEMEVVEPMAKGAGA